MVAQTDPVPQTLNSAARAAVLVAVAILTLRVVAWLLTRSAAVLADAIEPFFNLLAAGVTALGVAAGRRPADEEHPYGHRKIEYVVVLFHGVCLWAGALVVVWAAWWQLASGTPMQPTPVAAGLFLVSIVLSYWLGERLRHAGLAHDSPALQAAGRHARSDVWIAVGVLLNLLMAVRHGGRWLDTLFCGGLIVAIVADGVRLTVRAVAGLMDTALPEVRETVRRTLAKLPDDRLVGYHDIRCRDSGGHIFVDFHLQFASWMTLEAAHDLAERIEARVEAAIGSAEATAHLEPASEVREDRPLARGALTDREIGRRRAALASLLVATGLGAVKFAAYVLTGSAAILSDALESLVNVVAAGFAVFAVRLSRAGGDEEHPYGHHKVEFLAAAFEGLLILGAAVLIAVAALPRLWHPKVAEQLGLGLVLLVGAGAINGLLGWYLIRTGRRLASLTLEADGRHVLSDVWTSGAVVSGLALGSLVRWPWLDPVLALGVACYLLYTGLHLAWRALYGIIDSVDAATVQRATGVLEASVTAGEMLAWHKLRVRDVGAIRFIEAHIQLPDGCSLQAAHEVSEQLEARLEEALAPASAILHAEPAREAAGWVGRSPVSGRE